LHIRQAAEKKLGTSLDTPRVNARLRKEAKRVKEVLSANSEMHLSIENLTPSDDFFHTITRSEFETLCADLLERSYAPVEQALRQANISVVCTHDPLTCLFSIPFQLASLHTYHLLGLYWSTIRYDTIR